MLTLPPVERARAGAIWGLARAAGANVADADVIRCALTNPEMRRRARRVGLLARGRFRGDPLARDNAHTRAALLLWQEAPPHMAVEAAAEAARSRLGMPSSEPGWVRLLDGTLMAAALQVRGCPDAADDWRHALTRWFRLRRQHRPAARHTFLGTAPVRAATWEHVAATAIALACGWIAPEEWAALRRPVLGAVGRGGRSIADNRLAAAGRCWAVQVGDEEALSLLQRVSPSEHDPTAQALQALASALGARPAALRPAPRPILLPL